MDSAANQALACTHHEVDSGAHNTDAIISNTILAALSDAFLARKVIKRAS